MFKWSLSDLKAWCRLAAQGEIYLDCVDQYWYPRVFPREKNEASEQGGKEKYTMGRENPLFSLGNKG